MIRFNVVEKAFQTKPAAVRVSISENMCLTEKRCSSIFQALFMLSW